MFYAINLHIFNYYHTKNLRIWNSRSVLKINETGPCSGGDI